MANTILINGDSAFPGNREDWSVNPNLNNTFTDGTFAALVPGFVPLPLFNTVALSAGAVAAGNVDLALSDADWNLLKDIELDFEGAGNFHIRNFVHVDLTTNLVDLNAAANIELENVKRGQVTTGNGNDTVDAELYSNGGWVNQLDINTGNGNDVIYASGGSLVNTVFGGNSPYDGVLHEVFVDGGEGNNTVILNGAKGGPNSGAGDFGSLNHVRTLGGTDLIVGGKGVDIIGAGRGNDTVSGGLGDDFVYGGGGNDRLQGDLYQPNNGYAGDGNDVVIGGGGCDRIVAQQGDDLVFGDNYIAPQNICATPALSAEVLAVLAAKESAINAAYADTAITVNDPDEVFSFGPTFFYDLANSNQGNDTIYADNGDDTVFGGGCDDSIHGGNDQDLLFGDGGNHWGWDTINGGNGDDTIYGGKGCDRITGLTDDSTKTVTKVAGQPTTYSAVFTGGDFLYGGTGKDTFAITKTSEVDRVGDFQHGIDLVEVSYFTAAQLFNLGTDTAVFVNGTTNVVLHAENGYNWDVSDFVFV